MPAQLTTRAQVNGYRFLLKRYEHALIRRDVRMLHDPMRSQFRSLIVGAVLAVLVVAGAAILAFIRPQGSIGTAKIVVAKDSGALYVLVDGTIHPVLNLASARLITGTAADPVSVGSSELTQPRGPMLGIPGAPAALPGPATASVSTWTLCDAVQVSESGSAAGSPGAQTTIIAGALDISEPAAAGPLSAQQAVLASNGGHTYLLYDGKRAQVNPDDSVLVRSLGLQRLDPRPMTTGMLNSALPVPPLVAPNIPDRGKPGPRALSDVPIGAVIQVHEIDTDKLYVVLPNGVQQITPFAAEMIRNANSQGLNQIMTVTPDRLVGVPVIDQLQVDQFPQQIPTVLSADDDPVSCISWSQRPGTLSSISMLAGRELPLPSGAAPVTLASAPDIGDGVHAVYMKPGTGQYVQAVGEDPGSVSRGPLYYLADNGILYGVPDPNTAAVLGLPKAAQPAPEPILHDLVAGPELDSADALVSHDTLPQAPS